jgi:2-dehydro-3-deoxy-D-arabinonate dehydratase
MKLLKYLDRHGVSRVGLIDNETIIPLNLPNGPAATLADILESENPRESVEWLRLPDGRLPLAEAKLLAPIDRQEVWAAGVTYKRSRTARMEESEAAASCYDRVYVSPRPELFMKATPHRVSGPEQPLRIRYDATWNVPEPELTLVINSQLKLVGFTVGNDMSSRDIEGDNPLYLPQAKVYNQCCGLGPWITLADCMPAREAIGIKLSIVRDNRSVYEGETSVAQMARTFEDLIGWLGRDNSFPNGVFLLTGTGVVPPSDFTLQAGDRVDITIDGIGTLSNPIVQGE